MASKLKVVKGRGNETYNTKDLRKVHKEDSKVDVETEEEQEAPVPLITHVNNIMHSIFSIVEVYIKNQQIYNSNGLYANKTYISNNFKGVSLNTREFCTARFTTMFNF